MATAAIGPAAQVLRGPLVLKAVGAEAEQVEKIGRIFQPVLQPPQGGRRGQGGTRQTWLFSILAYTRPLRCSPRVVAEIVAEEDQHHGVAGPEAVVDVSSEKAGTPGPCPRRPDPSCGPADRQSRRCIWLVNRSSWPTP